MALAQILVNQTKTLGAQMYMLSNNLRDARAKVSDLKLIMDNMTDGVDFTVIEAQFGLVTGKGTLLYTLITTLNTQISGSTALNQFVNEVTPL